MNIKSRNRWAVSALLFTAMGFSSLTNAALVSRLGGLAYYDDVADLTWLADANAAGAAMNWTDANNWAAGLTVDGIDGWRLADTLQPDANCSDQGPGFSYAYNCTGSEMGDLFYNALGNAAGALSNTGPFSNVQFDYYWSATEYDATNAWRFNMGAGGQYSYYKSSSNYAWAVQSGDVSAVPVPAAVWLFGSGLLGLIGVAKRKQSVLRSYQYV